MVVKLDEQGVPEMWLHLDSQTNLDQTARFDDGIQKLFPHRRFSYVVHFLRYCFDRRSFVIRSSFVRQIQLSRLWSERKKLRVRWGMISMCSAGAAAKFEQFGSSASRPITREHVSNVVRWGRAHTVQNNTK